MRLFSIIFLSTFLFSCSEKESNNDQEWLRGTSDEKISQVATHLRGFDIAMAEVGYRYKELYFAGETENWDYASYQIDKIQRVIELAAERRPARKESADLFVNNTIPQVKEAIAQKDKAIFIERMQSLTTGCNSCHQLEGYEFIVVEEATSKSSPVK
jgi:hypothetical protein